MPINLSELLIDKGYKISRDTEGLTNTFNNLFFEKKKPENS